jgi:hypothetical protein
LRVGWLQCGPCARQFRERAVGGNPARGVDEGRARWLAAEFEIVEGGAQFEETLIERRRPRRLGSAILYGMQTR